MSLPPPLPILSKLPLPTPNPLPPTFLAAWLIFPLPLLPSQTITLLLSSDGHMLPPLSLSLWEHHLPSYMEPRGKSFVKRPPFHSSAMDGEEGCRL